MKRVCGVFWCVSGVRSWGRSGVAWNHSKPPTILDNNNSSYNVNSSQTSDLSDITSNGEINRMITEISDPKDIKAMARKTEWILRLVLRGCLPCFFIFGFNHIINFVLIF
jgi:hypothetical protein